MPQSSAVLPDGRWFDAARHTWRNGRGRPARWPIIEQAVQMRQTRVILAAAHLNHDPATIGSYAAPSVICSWARNPLSVILPNAATTASARARDRHGVPGVIRAARRPRARRAAAHFGAAGLDRAAQHGLEVVVP